MLDHCGLQGRALRRSSPIRPGPAMRRHRVVSAEQSPRKVKRVFIPEQHLEKVIGPMLAHPEGKAEFTPATGFVDVDNAALESWLVAMRQPDRLPLVGLEVLVGRVGEEDGAMPLEPIRLE